MNLRKLTLLSLWATLAAAALAQAVDAPADKPAAGKQLVGTLGCALCHQVEGQGGKAGQPLSSYAGKPASELEAALLDPKKVLGPSAMMPSYQSLLTPAQLDAVVAYIKSQPKP